MYAVLSQITSGPDPEKNLQAILDDVEILCGPAEPGDHPDLIVYPEAAFQAFGTGPLTRSAEAIDRPGGRMDRLAAAAREHRVTLIAGGFTPSAADPPRTYNSLWITDGHRRTVYNKIHCYDAFGFQETETVAPGRQPVLVPVTAHSEAMSEGGPVVRLVGVTACYDLRFPALYTELAAAGAEVLVCCASWGSGEGKVRQWRSLATARALDTATPVLACGQAAPAEGTEAAHSTAPTGVGHSLAVSADGSVLGELGPEPGHLHVRLDHEHTTAMRKALAVLENRQGPHEWEPVRHGY